MLQNGHSHSKNIFWPQVDTTFGTRVPVVPFGTHMAPLGANMDPVGTPIFDSVVVFTRMDFTIMDDNVVCHVNLRY